MAGSAERKVVRSRQLRDLLAASARSVQMFRKLSGFPKPLTMPGQPRWYEDEILAWRDRRDLADVVIGAELDANREAEKLSDAELQRQVLDWCREQERHYRAVGKTANADKFREVADAIKQLGEFASESARQFVRQVNSEESAAGPDQLARRLTRGSSLQDKRP